MMVSNIMVINDLTTVRRADGARCSGQVLDGICSHMAQPSSSSMCAKLSTLSTDDVDDECERNSPTSSSRERHPFAQAIERLCYIEDFDFLGKLGEGFFSTVLKVRSRKTGEEMVMKVPKPSCTGSRRAVHADAAHEATMLQRLKHPNIVGLKGLCISLHEGGWDMLILIEYCAGGSLSQRILDRSRRFSWLDRVRLAHHIASAMEFIHSREIIHRDLTSMNVLLQTTGSEERAVVADFGLSCSFPKRGQKLPQVGTTYFMSPECLKEEYYDEKSDVFSFGIILCQTIARIEADPDSGLHRTSVFGLDYMLFTPSCPPDTPDDFLQLAFISCVLNPVARPSFRSLSISLRALLDSMPTSPSPPRACRSRSDAALKRPKSMPVASRKLSSTLHAVRCKPVVEGVALEDESSRSAIAMEAMARDVSNVETHGHLNPFMKHERFRKERKIVPRGSGRRRFPVPLEAHRINRSSQKKHGARQRSASLPSELNSSLPRVENVDRDQCDLPSGIPLAYRDYDRKFQSKTMNRYPSRRYTMAAAECLSGSTTKSSFEIREISTTQPRISTIDILSPVHESLMDESRSSVPPSIRDLPVSSRCSTPDPKGGRKGMTWPNDDIVSRTCCSPLQSDRRRSNHRCIIS